MAKIDSGLGWKVDEEFYIYEADTLIDEDDYGRKKYDGAAIIAIVFKGENTQGYPVMISTIENNCLNTQAMTTYSSIVGGVTWYGTRQNTLLRENEIIVGAKVTVAEGINPYHFPDDADTRAAIISAIITQAGVEYTPKVTTTDYVKGYVEGVVKENNTLMLDAVDDILADDTAYPSSAMMTIPDCKVPANAAVSVEFEPIQEGTGDPSPENIRPISGRNNISITRTGKNLFNIGALTYPFDNNGVTVSMSDGVLTMNGTTTDEFVYPPSPDDGHSYPNQLIFMNLKPSTSYIFTTGYANVKLNAFYRETEYGAGIKIAETNGTGIMTFTTPLNYAVIWIRIVVQSGTALNNVKFYPMIRLASDPDSTFAPYTSTDYTLSLNGTRYGGRVDISDTGEAVLTVDRKCITLNLSDANETATLGDFTRYTFYNRATDVDVTRINDSTICDVAPWEVDWSGQYNHFYIDYGSVHFGWVLITIPTSSISSISSFQLCYPIASPFQIPLKSTPIKLERGTNNLYSAAGDISTKTNGITSAIGALTEQVNDITLYPAPPTTDGTYTLQVTVASGVPAYSWAAVNRNAPAVNESDEELKKSEDSGDISEKNENSEEKEIDISEKDVSEPAEKKEDIPDESEKELEEDIPAEEEKSELTDEPVESAEKMGEDITEENGDAEVEKILESE